MNSPMTKKICPDMPTPIPGKKFGPELDSYKPTTDVPVGETIMGGPKPGYVETPFKDNAPFGNQTSIKNIKGRKNP